MTLAETLQPKLSEWRPAGPGPLRWEAEVAGWTVALDAVRAESLGCELSELTLSRVGAAPDGLTAAAWAEGITQRTRALLEPLAIIEVDDHHGVATLRSQSPARRAGARLYYELTLTGIDRAALRRYRLADGATRREAVPFALTHEALALAAEQIAG